MTKNKIGIVILGGTGYGAGELLRLLLNRQDVEVVSVVSSSAADSPLESAHPHLAGLYKIKFSEKADYTALSQHERALIFSSLPHGASAEAIAELAALPACKNIKVIDLSGDFRLKNEAVHAEFYADSPLSKELREKFVYGIPELNREAISTAQFIANPGCFATACILAVAPLLDGKWKSNLIFDAKSGTSGAGRSLNATFHHAKRHASFAAYKVLNHRHEPEIREALMNLSRTEFDTAFVPHLIPNSRGIYVTAYATLESALSADEIKKLYAQFYSGCPFVRLRSEPPELDNVVGSNFCDISVTVRGKQIVCNAALDNLVKGMAGQAIQNMNLVFGLDETSGLTQAPLSLI